MTPKEEILLKLKRFLFGRRYAYLRIFKDDSVDTKIVLQDLAKFCRAYESTFHSDPRAHAVLEGRREVWLRICHHLKMSQDEFWEKYGRRDLE